MLYMLARDVASWYGRGQLIMSHAIEAMCSEMRSAHCCAVRLRDSGVHQDAVSMRRTVGCSLLDRIYLHAIVYSGSCYVQFHGFGYGSCEHVSAKFLPRAFELSIDNIGHHLFQHGASTADTSLEVCCHALFDVFSNHVDLNVDVVTLLFLRHYHLLLCVSNQHNLPPPFSIIHFRHGQRSSIKCHITLFNHISQDALVLRRQAICNSISIWPLFRDAGYRIHMSLHEMTSHSRACTDCTLEVRASQCFWRHSNFEIILAELGDRQARSIDADAVSKIAITQYLSSTAYGQGGAAAAAGGVIELDEFRYSWPSVSAASQK
ncbi:hypothetical protein AC579_650 [Pseudocercospora musae]|uniref:Uncharacterized protein n=1 Tax=Pseudocercospora musae TaxID=113226 RepID=A0A139I8P7_9PEZI|nr:hypothetical protein AC579_650 [Pseudocercospora musae]